MELKEVFACIIIFGIIFITWKYGGGSRYGPTTPPSNPTKGDVP